MKNGLLAACVAAFAMVLIGGAPSRAETIIDEWQNVKAPPAPKLESVTLDPKTTALPSGVHSTPCMPLKSNVQRSTVVSGLSTGIVYKSD